MNNKINKQNYKFFVCEIFHNKIKYHINNKLEKTKSLSPSILRAPKMFNSENLNVIIKNNDVLQVFLLWFLCSIAWFVKIRKWELFTFYLYTHWLYLPIIRMFNTSNWNYDSFIVFNILAKNNNLQWVNLK